MQNFNQVYFIHDQQFISIQFFHQSDSFHIEQPVSSPTNCPLLEGACTFLLPLHTSQFLDKSIEKIKRRERSNEPALLLLLVCFRSKRQRSEVRRPGFRSKILIDSITFAGRSSKIEKLDLKPFEQYKDPRWGQRSQSRVHPRVQNWPSTKGPCWKTLSATGFNMIYNIERTMKAKQLLRKTYRKLLAVMMFIRTCVIRFFFSSPVAFRVRKNFV